MNNSILTIIVTYNGMKWIDKCIQSVLSSTVRSDVFVIDNASTDETPDYIAVNYPSVHLIRSQKNLGFGQANNIGLQYAIDNNYDYVYLLNQDAWVKNDTFDIMISTQRNYPEYGVLSPIQLDGDESAFDFDFGEEISLWSKESKVCEDLFFDRTKEIVPFPMLMAAHWLISRKCLINVGGFSPAFFHYGEDNNYANRVWGKGFKTGVVMNAKAVHDRKGRFVSEEKKIFHEYCARVVEISNLNSSAKCVLWGYTYEIFLKILFSQKKLFPRLMNYIKFLFQVPKYIKIKNNSLKKCAFLNYNEVCKFNQHTPLDS